MRRNITYLDLVLPFVAVYSSFLLLYKYFIEEEPKADGFHVTIIFIIAFLSTYGFISLWVDLKRGFKYIIKKFNGR